MWQKGGKQRVKKDAWISLLASGCVETSGLFQSAVLSISILASVKICWISESYCFPLG